MTQEQFTTEDVRAEFRLRLEGKTQIEIAREIGIKPQNLSAMVAGAPINGKVLAWLGFRRIEGLFEKTKEDASSVNG